MPLTTLSDASADSLPAPGSLEALRHRIGHHFGDPALLEQAFRHRSWCAEHEGPSNERLEFLGDSVLGLAVTDFVYRTYPTLAEGSLAKIRASVVSAACLADLAAELELGRHLLLGRGEEATGGRAKTSILADAVEAVIGAVFVDSGWATARDVVLRLLDERIRAAAEQPGTADFKTRLQELLARRGAGSWQYAMTEDGPDHDKRFVACVVVDEQPVGSGAGRSKKQAQQAAAQDAWERLVRDRGERTDTDARAT